mmetsp:Transcript_37421/g.63003  ORF Transcript_37421/g.63003 Transcript_37421/m.63003 type:complete len:231 (-) Transcript_37421:218-910(-)
MASPMHSASAKCDEHQSNDCGELKRIDRFKLQSHGSVWYTVCEPSFPPLPFVCVLIPIVSCMLASPPRFPTLICLGIPCRAGPSSLVPCEPNCELSRGIRSVNVRKEVPSILAPKCSWLPRGVRHKPPCIDVPRSKPASIPLPLRLIGPFSSLFRTPNGWSRLGASSCCVVRVGGGSSTPIASSIGVRIPRLTAENVCICSATRLSDLQPIFWEASQIPWEHARTSSVHL